MFDDEQRAVLTGKQNAYLATVMPDGSPHVTPVWVDVDGEDLLVSTTEGTVKLANMLRDPRVAVAIRSEADRYRVLTVRGTVVATEGGDAVDEHIDELSLRHDGVHWQFDEGEVRVRLRIRPRHISWV